MSKSAVKGLVALSAVGGLLYSSLFTVEPGHAAILFNKFSGVKPEIYQEGIHFKIPFIERQILFNIRPHQELFTSITGTRDLQNASVSVSVLCRPVVHNLPTIFMTSGPDFIQRVMPILVKEVLKSEIAKYNSSQLDTQREQVSIAIRQLLITRASEFNIIVDDLSITNLVIQSL